MDYPDSFFRGITDKNLINSDDRPSASIFHFGEKKKVAERGDGNNEESIFWNDDNKAVELILTQVKDDGKIQFKGGAAHLDRKALDDIRRLPDVKGLLSYERSPLPNNEYHGNLLLSSTVDNKRMEKIAAAIALCCLEIISQKE